MKKKILLAYSGGLDTSAIIPWLIENCEAEIVAYCSDLGNSPDEKTIGSRAKELGASEFIFEDVKKQFASEFIFPVIRSGAIYQDDYLLGTAIARPLIAERMVYWAKKKAPMRLLMAQQVKEMIKFVLKGPFLIFLQN